jgi:hypothetical protein
MQRLMKSSFAMLMLATSVVSANQLDNKHLFCKGICSHCSDRFLSLEKSGVSFREVDVYQSEVKIHTFSIVESYSTYAGTINWVAGGDAIWQLDRKTLKLETVNYGLVYQCTLLSSRLERDRMLDELKRARQQEVDDSMTDNKI